MEYIIAVANAERKGADSQYKASVVYKFAVHWLNECGGFLRQRRQLELWRQADQVSEYYVDALVCTEGLE